MIKTFNKIKGLWMALLVLFAIVPALLAQSTVDATYSTTINGRLFQILIPAGTSSVRGILVYAPGTNGSTLTQLSGSWIKANAQLYGYALMGWDNGGKFAISDLDNAILNVQNQSGITSLNPNTPRVAMGFSAGGGNSWQQVQSNPERVIFYTINKGSSSYSAGPLPLASLGVPGVNVRGTIESSDKMIAQDNLFTLNRGNGALLAKAIDEGAKHATGDVYEHLTFPYLWLLEKDRNPNGALPLTSVSETNGWLADLDTMNSPMIKIYPYANYPAGKDKLKAAWLYNKDAAYVYASFTTFNKKINLLGADKSIQLSTKKLTFTAEVDASLIPTLQKIELYDYSKSVATNLPGNYSFILTNLTRGIHHLFIIATTNDGTQYISDPNTILIK